MEYVEIFSSQKSVFDPKTPEKQQQEEGLKLLMIFLGVFLIARMVTLLLRNAPSPRPYTPCPPHQWGVTPPEPGALQVLKCEKPGCGFIAGSQDQYGRPTKGESDE